MKQLDLTDLENRPGIRLREGDTFRLQCYPGIGCFGRCCRNLNLFLYPYDVLRLRARLGITSDRLLDRHVDVVLRPGNFFPDVLLRMTENSERTCPFLAGDGCGVYPDRPDTCRTFPLEQGLVHDSLSGADLPVYFFRPPAFCQGQHEARSWTVPGWVKDQEAQDYHRMTIRWAEVKRLFQNDPWGSEGPEGRRARMAFMAAYNLDRFREFVFGSSFLTRFRVNPERISRIEREDVQLMLLGFEWIRLFLWGIRSPDLAGR